MTNEKEKIYKAKAVNLLREYDDFLKEILKEEEEKIPTDNIGNNEFEVVSKTYLNKGIREGLKRFMATLNHWATIT